MIASWASLVSPFGAMCLPKELLNGKYEGTQARRAITLQWQGS